MRKFLFSLAFILLLISCQQRHHLSDDVFDYYDKLEISDFQKERFLDSIKYNLLSLNNDSLNRQYLFKIASRYERLDAQQKYLRIINTLYDLSRQADDTLSLARALWYKGDYFSNKEVLDSSFYYYSQAEKFYRLSGKEPLNWARVLMYKSEALFKSGIYSESEVELAKAIKIFKQENDARLLYESNLQMALILQQIKDFDSALYYYRRAQEYLEDLYNKTPEELGNINSKISLYNNLGNFYNSRREYEKANTYYQKALNYPAVVDNPRLYARVLNNYGYNKLLAGDNKGVDTLLFKSLKIRESLFHEQGIIASKIRIGEYYVMRKQIDSAVTYFKEAYELARKTGNFNDVVKCLEHLSVYDTGEESYDYANRYMLAKDSLRTVENMTRNKFARISYETQEITQENEFLVKRNWYLFFLFLFMMLTSLGVFISYHFKLKNKELQHKAKEQESTERIYELLLNEKLVEEEVRAQERDRISAELHDGVVNRIFTTRLNLELLESADCDLKNKLLTELRKTEQHVREVSHQLHDNFLVNSQDFARLLEDLCANQRNPFNTQFEIDIDNSVDWSRVSSKDKVHVYRIIQEAFQNINKYSYASKCFLFIFKIDDYMIVRVHDNGIGFNINTVKMGLGLTAFYKRAEQIKGTMTIASSKGKGTTIELKFKCK